MKRSGESQTLETKLDFIALGSGQEVGRRFDATSHVSRVPVCVTRSILCGISHSHNRRPRVCLAVCLSLALRSCHVLNFKGKKVMLDCGVHPASRGIVSRPAVWSQLPPRHACLQSGRLLCVLCCAGCDPIFDARGTLRDRHLSRDSLPLGPRRRDSLLDGQDGVQRQSIHDACNQGRVKADACGLRHGPGNPPSLSRLCPTHRTQPPHPTQRKHASPIAPRAFFCEIPRVGFCLYDSRKGAREPTSRSTTRNTSTSAWR